MPAVAQHLEISLNVLFDAQPKAAAKSTPAKRGPTPKWQQQMELIATLRRAKQQVVMQMLDGLLAGVLQHEQQPSATPAATTTTVPALQPHIARPISCRCAISA